MVEKIVKMMAGSTTKPSTLPTTPPTRQAVSA